nr:MAG TPA: hypothetical protein [Caudoviricetes sp.]
MSKRYFPYIAICYIYPIISIYIGKSTVVSYIKSICSSIPFIKAFNSSLVCLCISSE